MSGDTKTGSEADGLEHVNQLKAACEIVGPDGGGRRTRPVIPALICYVVVEDRGDRKGCVLRESRCREHWGSEMWL